MTNNSKHTAILIASGPSLTQADVDFCRGKGKVYVINNSYKLAPWADVLYSCDYKWWEQHKGATEFKGERWAYDPQCAEFGCNIIGHYDGPEPFSPQPGFIKTGNNSGFQALNLAVLQGAARVILLGYDMGYTDPNHTHFFGNHPSGLQDYPDFSLWIKYFNEAAPYIPVPVINCTRRTALQCFETRSLELALCD